MSTGGGSATGAGGAFIPPGQPGAAAGLLPQIGPIAAQGLQGLNTLGGNSPAGYAWPFVQGTTQNTLLNPYAGGAIAGGQDAASIFQNQILPETFSTAPSLLGLGSLAAGQAGGVPGLTYANPAYGQAGGVGAGLSPQFGGSVGGALATAFDPQYQMAEAAGQGYAEQLGGAASQILGTAFDPQQALYQRTLQQVQDQTNAGLAGSGVLGTPYGGSVLGNTLGNFNIDWQNNLLNRMTQGGQAAQGLDTAALSSLTNPALARAQGLSTGASAAEGLGSSALSSLLEPANAQTAATLEGTNALGSLTNTAGGAYGGSLGELGSLASSAPGLLGAPYNAYQGIQGNNFGALQNEIALGNQNYTVPQQTISDLMQYLGLGQSASGLANTIGATNFGQLAQGVGGAGQLLGGVNNLFGGGGGGGGGAFGTGGLFGSQGPLFGTAADASIAGGGPPLAAGGGSSLAELAPLAFAGS